MLPVLHFSKIRTPHHIEVKFNFHFMETTHTILMILFYTVFLREIWHNFASSKTNIVYDYRWEAISIYYFHTFLKTLWSSKRILSKLKFILKSRLELCKHSHIKSSFYLYYLRRNTILYDNRIN